MSKNRKVLVTGGAGYVGSQLVSLLAKENYDVIIYDTFWFSEPSSFSHLSNVKCITGDIRDHRNFKLAIEGCTDVIHLACISNDPSFDLNPTLGKEINYDCFKDIVEISKNAGVTKFIYASSSSVYGVREEDNVTEELTLDPLTDYSKYKALCEDILIKYSDDNFCTTVLRPATVCGYSNRQRLDVVVNILTNHAINNGVIKIFGGEQRRPNIHIKDMVRAYLSVLEADKELINKKIYNVGCENLSVSTIATLVSKATGVEKIQREETDDIRSYHISSEKFIEELNFEMNFSVEDAVKDLTNAFHQNIFTSPLSNPLYFNVKHLLENKLS